jgi:Mg/Co/Ni transporter MgtE
MPVVDDDERIVGIVSLGDIAAKSPDDEVDVAMSLGDISSPAEPDRSGSGQPQSQSQSQSQALKTH